MENHMRVVWGLFALLVVLFIAAPVATAAGLVFKTEGLDGQPAGLRLLDEPCVDAKVKAVLKEKIRADMVPKFRRAVLTYGGRDWASCWLAHEGMVYSIDEEGAPFQPVPIGMFRDDYL